MGRFQLHPGQLAAAAAADLQASISAGGTSGLVAFLKSVRCEQYLAPLIELGASEVADLKDMQVRL